MSLSLYEAFGLQLQDPDAGVRVAAAEALGRHGSKASCQAQALAEAAHDPDPVVRRAVAKAMVQVGPVCASALAHKLQDHNIDLRRSAARALGLFGASAAGQVETLARTALSDSDEWVRHNAQEALGAIGEHAGPKGAAASALGLWDPDMKVRRLAAASLGRQGQHGLAHASDLADTLAKDRDVHIRAHRALCNLSHAPPVAPRLADPVRACERPTLHGQAQAIAAAQCSLRYETARQLGTSTLCQKSTPPGTTLPLWAHTTTSARQAKTFEIAATRSVLSAR